MALDPPLVLDDDVIVHATIPSAAPLPAASSEDRTRTPVDLVTVVIPARNEQTAIGPCLDSVLAQDWPALQVIVVDGNSVDDTVAVVRERARDSGPHSVEVLENDLGTIPRSLNIATAAARGRWLVRVDAHASVPPDYVRKVVAHLVSGRWGGVGGRKDGVGGGPAGDAIAAAMGSRFGVGGSTYHHGTTLQEVEHIPFGAYPVALVRELGGWDEELRVNQDFEFDYRLRAAGHRLLFDPELVIRWENRRTVGALFSQYRRYGRGKVKVASKHPDSLRARHFAPPILVATLAAAAVAAPTRPKLAVALAAPYAALVAVGSAQVVSKVASTPQRLRVPASLVAMHVGWGFGFYEGVVDQLRNRTRGSGGREARPAR